MALGCRQRGGLRGLAYRFLSASTRETLPAVTSSACLMTFAGTTATTAPAAESIRTELTAQLLTLQEFDNEALLARRYERLMSYGIA